MNRAERRREGVKNTEKIYTLNESQIKRLKDDAAKEAIDTAFILMLGLPVMILHDKYSLLMKREVDGKCREERFTDLLLDLYDSFDKGYLKLDDILKCIKEECGIDIARKKV